jgi:preprotein translocase subunit SecE
MGRLLKKKTESQKTKLKLKQQNKSENGTSDDDSSGILEVPKKEAQKSPIIQRKNVVSIKPEADGEPNFIEKAKTFLDEVNNERKKVVWPAKNQIVASTVVVIILVVIVSSCLGVFDLILNSLISLVLN